jgi:hypothetical protein
MKLVIGTDLGQLGAHDGSGRTVFMGAFLHNQGRSFDSKTDSSIADP